MANAEFDLSALEKWSESVKKMLEDERDAFFDEVARLVAAEFIKMVQEKTPKATGKLQENWRIKEILKTTDGYEIVVFNPVEYASYVEYGHRKINKKGENKGFTEGRFMIQKTEIEIESKMQELIERKYNEFLSKVLNP